MGLLIDIIAIFLVVGGLFFFLGSGIGIVRFPDFYTRMHAAGKGDTLSSLLILTGLGVYHLHHLELGALSTWPALLVIIKIIAICAFIMLTSPTSTHALMEAGYEDGIKPLITKGKVNPLARKAKVRGQAEITEVTPAIETEIAAKKVTKSTPKKSPKKKIPAKKKKSSSSAKKTAKKATKKTAAKKSTEAKSKRAAKKSPKKKVAAKKKSTPKKPNK